MAKTPFKPAKLWQTTLPFSRVLLSLLIKKACEWNRSGKTITFHRRSHMCFTPVETSKHKHWWVHRFSMPDAAQTTGNARNARLPPHGRPCSTYWLPVSTSTGTMSKMSSHTIGNRTFMMPVQWKNKRSLIPEPWSSAYLCLTPQDRAAQIDTSTFLRGGHGESLKGDSFCPIYLI